VLEADWPASHSADTQRDLSLLSVLFVVMDIVKIMSVCTLILLFCVAWSLQSDDKELLEQGNIMVTEYQLTYTCMTPYISPMGLP